jgi:hypothetical protein
MPKFVSTVFEKSQLSFLMSGDVWNESYKLAGCYQLQQCRLGTYVWPDMGCLLGAEVLLPAYNTNNA